MRFWKGMGVITALAVVASLLHSQYLEFDRQVKTSAIVGGKFVTLPNSEDNAKLVALRKQCGSMTAAVQELRPRIGDDDGEETSISYLELVGDVVDSFIYDSVIPGECILATEEGWFILLSTKGDMFVGLNGRAITTHSEALRQEQNEVAESGSVWNRMRSIIGSRG